MIRKIFSQAIMIFAVLCLLSIPAFADLCTDGCDYDHSVCTSRVQGDLADCNDNCYENATICAMTLPYYICQDYYDSCTSSCSYYASQDQDDCDDARDTCYDSCTPCEDVCNDTYDQCVQSVQAIASTCGNNTSCHMYVYQAFLACQAEQQYCLYQCP